MQFYSNLGRAEAVVCDVNFRHALLDIHRAQDRQPRAQRVPAIALSCQRARSLSLTHTHTHSLSLTHTHSLSLSLPHTHTLSLSHTHTHTHTLSRKHSCSLSHTSGMRFLTSTAHRIASPAPSECLPPRGIQKREPQSQLSPSLSLVLTNLSLTLTHTFSIPLSHSLTHSLSHTQTRSPSLSLGMRFLTTTAHKIANPAPSECLPTRENP